MRRRLVWSSFFISGCLSLAVTHAFGTAAESYDPAWGSELNFASNNLFTAPTGSAAWLEERDIPWWQSRVVNPIMDYSGGALPTGSARVDTAVDLELTSHRVQSGWTLQPSPTGINNVYKFTPGSSVQDSGSTRFGQNAYVDLSAHPFQYVTANIGAELVGNYDERYWLPNNDELRMHNQPNYAKIVTGEIKYDDKTVMIRGFEAVPQYGWLTQNDLFGLLPSMTDPEYYRELEGTLDPRGGEFRVKSQWGTLDVMGGTELQLRYGSSVFAKYDFPTFRNWENTLVYRNQNIPWGLENPDERQWSLSYNSSYPFSDQATGHFGILYQPFRLNRDYQDVDSNGNTEELRSMQRDAFGTTARVEYKPERFVELVGLGYTYEGPVAGNKQQVDADATKSITSAWTLSPAYIYRQPIRGPVPLRYEGTSSSPGALISEPRGPDDPFTVQWDNRKAHIGSLTLVYDPTPGTPFFRYQKNNLEEWNLNPDEEATWTGAVQYRVTEYPTNTDRLYYYDEDGHVIFDPTFHSGALATDYPFSSATGLLRWTHDDWRITFMFSGGQALAGSGVAYTAATDFYKPSTTFLDGGITVAKGPWKTFFRYGQDEFGPLDYFTQLGWTYHRIYQAGLSYQFLKAFELGFRYVGTRMNDEFIGSNVGAFNEYRGYVTYHFSLEHNFSTRLAAIGKPLPQVFPEAGLTVSDAQFSPDGSTTIRSVVLTPQTSSDAGVLSYKILIRNSRGETVKEWDGSGIPRSYFNWDGLDADEKPLAPGTYRATLDVVDQNGNEVTSTPRSIQIIGAAPSTAPVAVETPMPTPTPAAPLYAVTTTAEGLRVTLSSLVLFDVDKAELKDSSKQGLDQVDELLKAYPTNTLRVSGHTDSSGNSDHNQSLSEHRAQSVATYLISKGIEASRVKTIGYGDRRPVTSNKTLEGRQQNRRVEIDILK